MSTDTYKTISAPSEGYFTDRKSKFYAYAYPVRSEDEVKQILKTLHKRYHDARHIVYAFVLGPEAKIYRASDAGEPAGSSGPPVLRAIQSKGLTDVMVAVVRYFGGKKLGIPGLINAYHRAAIDALDNAVIEEKVVTDRFLIVCPYNKVSQVMNLLQNLHGQIVQQSYSADCQILVDIPRSLSEQFVHKAQQWRIKVEHV